MVVCRAHVPRVSLLNSPADRDGLMDADTPLVLAAAAAAGGGSAAALTLLLPRPQSSEDAPEGPAVPVSFRSSTLATEERLSLSVLAGCGCGG